MFSTNNKLRTFFIALFLGFWMFSAVQLGKTYMEENDVSTDVESVILQTTASTKSIKDKTLQFTGFIWVIHYFYQK